MLDAGVGAVLLLALQPAHSRRSCDFFAGLQPFPRLGPSAKMLVSGSAAYGNTSVAIPGVLVVQHGCLCRPVDHWLFMPSDGSLYYAACHAPAGRWY